VCVSAGGHAVRAELGRFAALHEQRGGERAGCARFEQHAGGCGEWRVAGRRPGCDGGGGGAKMKGPGSLTHGLLGYCELHND
jgi:hypothetical protein